MNTWPGDGKGVFKIVYDRSAAEVRVYGRTGSGLVSQTFPVAQSLEASLEQAEKFVRKHSAP